MVLFVAAFSMQMNSPSIQKSVSSLMLQFATTCQYLVAEFEQVGGFLFPVHLMLWALLDTCFFMGVIIMVRHQAYQRTWKQVRFASPGFGVSGS
jgi:hypothetical protein